QAGGVAAQDKRRPWHTDRARVSRRMGLQGGWGAPPPGANPTPGGPSGSTNESTHRGPSRAALFACLPWPVVTEGSGRPTQPAPSQGESAASLPMPPGTERCQLGGGGSSQEDADCWRHRKPPPARYFGRGYCSVLPSIMACSVIGGPAGCMSAAAILAS